MPGREITFLRITKAASPEAAFVILKKTYSHSIVAGGFELIS